MNFLFLGEELRAVTEPIDRIISAVVTLFGRIFYITSSGSSVANTSWMKLLIDTIINNNFLLVGLSLLFCGFVLGILKRMIQS